ncbi:peptidase inhibitor family I36 protein, partial [Streptomyces sp. NPDC050423]|uniref:peptidase inhibitor family I36 protein n=1 Tax=Streptomyces sp. NPDC050423 TaxID=3155402 RepID=UPI0034434596
APPPLVTRRPAHFRTNPRPHRSGLPSKRAAPNSDWSAWTINNHDSSWYNHGTSGLNACVWQGYYYTGSVKVVASGTSSPQDAAHAHLGSSNNWGC